jgi:hypothetical protein
MTKGCCGRARKQAEKGIGYKVKVKKRSAFGEMDREKIPPFLTVLQAGTAACPTKERVLFS